MSVFPPDAKFPAACCTWKDEKTDTAKQCGSCRRVLLKESHYHLKDHNEIAFCSPHCQVTFTASRKDYSQYVAHRAIQEGMITTYDRPTWCFPAPLSVYADECTAEEFQSHLKKGQRVEILHPSYQYVPLTHVNGVPIRSIDN